MATLDVDALKWAKNLQDTQDRLFWDNERGGYFYSQANSANLVVRLKEGLYTNAIRFDTSRSCDCHRGKNAFFLKKNFSLDHDGAEPCGNSVAAKNLPIISAYFHDKSYKERASKLFQFFSSVTPFGYALPEMFSAQLLRANSLAMMVIVGMYTIYTVVMQFIYILCV